MTFFPSSPPQSDARWWNDENFYLRKNRFCDGTKEHTIHCLMIAGTVKQKDVEEEERIIIVALESV